MKKLVSMVLLCMVCTLAQGALIMEDGFEAAETLSGNGWSGNWNFSNTTYGNPYNYAWSDGTKGAISKDTGYVISNGDEVTLTFDIADMKPLEVGSAAVIVAELFYNDGTGDIVLGSLELNDDQVQATTDGILHWVLNAGLASLTVDASAGAGHNLLVSFDYDYSGGDQNYGIDNVAVSVVPEPATMLLLGLGAVTSLVRRKK